MSWIYPPPSMPVANKGLLRDSALSECNNWYNWSCWLEISGVFGVDPIGIHLDVSENGGTPKSSTLKGFSTINHAFWGTPILGHIHLGLHSKSRKTKAHSSCHVLVAPLRPPSNQWARPRLVRWRENIKLSKGRSIEIYVKGLIVSCLGSTAKIH